MCPLYCGYVSRIWCISLPQGTVHVVKRIRSNDRVLVYINTACSRQEGSLTGPWCSRFARMVRAVALWHCGYAARIRRISLPQGTIYVYECILSNDRVLVYINTACSTQEGSQTGLLCSYYARTARFVALWYCGYTARIRRISLRKGTNYVDKCKQSNSMVPRYINSTTSGRTWAVLGPSRWFSAPLTAALLAIGAKIWQDTVRYATYIQSMMR